MYPFAQVPSEVIKKRLFNNAMKSNWFEVIKIYERHPEVHKAKITKAGDTALHIAIADGQETAVKELVSFIVPKTPVALKIKNEHGNTPLHLAASMGSVMMCHYIAIQDSKLMGIRNNDGETPFFLAVLHGRKDAFLCLHSLCQDVNEGYGYCRGKHGDTILHSAISGEYFDMAFQIIHHYRKLTNWVNEQGFSPLHLLASKPSAFRSGSHIRGFEKLIYHCIFVDELEFSRHTLALAEDLQHDDKKPNYPENYQSCVGIFVLLGKITRVLMGHSNAQQGAKNPKGQQPVDKQEPGSSENRNIQIADAEGHQSGDEQVVIEIPVLQHPNRFKAQGHEFLPKNYITCFNILNYLLKFILEAVRVILGIGSIQIRKILEEKQKHIWSVQIMEILLEHSYWYAYGPNLATRKHEEIAPYALGDGGNVDIILESLNDTIHNDDHNRLPTTDISRHLKAKQINKGERNRGTIGKGEEETESVMKTRESPLLIAAKNGITEMVEKILQLFPMTIHDMNNEKKNIVLLAVENRQPHVYNFLLNQVKGKIIFQKTDQDGNNALHLAAMMGDHQLWRIPGPALKMQWETKWYEFVKNSMPPNFFAWRNNEGQTPSDVFIRDHQELVENAGNWLKGTSQSCSVVATLVATVAFATSTTVPGGVKSDSGIPTLEKEPAFCIFAISSLIALCFSVTSTFMFLAFFNSSYHEKDFNKVLPRKLLVGLTSLFVSLASMLVSFCAAHFLIMRDQLKYTAFPLYIVIFLLVTFYAIGQFPWYFDVAVTTFSNVPLRSYRPQFS